MEEAIIKSGTSLGFPVDPLNITLPVDGTCFVGEFGQPGADGIRPLKWFYQNSKLTLADIPKPAGDITKVAVTTGKGAFYYCAESTKGQWICTTKSS